MSSVTDLLNVPSRPIKQKIRLKVGRKSSYNQETVKRFCSKIAQGYSLADICGKDGMPTTYQVFDWKHKHPDFAIAYTQAMEERGMHFGHKLTDLAQGVLAGEIDPQAARVAGDFYKFTAARLASKTWGEKSQVTVEHGVSAQAAEVLRELSGRARQRQIEAQYIDVTPGPSLSTGVVTGTNTNNINHDGDERTDSARVVAQSVVIEAAPLSPPPPHEPLGPSVPEQPPIPTQPSEKITKRRKKNGPSL